jgi:DNA-binding NarL/FixJ family response regulator
LQEKLPDIGLTWYAAMLYICGQPIKEVAEDLYMDEQEVKAMLNNLVKDLKL